MRYVRATRAAFKGKFPGGIGGGTFERKGVDTLERRHVGKETETQTGTQANKGRE